MMLNLYGCNSYENKDKYEIKVGQTFEIYYSTNSCCYYCIVNESKLKHLKFIKRRTVDKGPKDCDGCNSTEAFVFRGESLGKEVVEIKRLGATMNCDDKEVNTEKYLVEIK